MADVPNVPAEDDDAATKLVKQKAAQEKMVKDEDQRYADNPPSPSNVEIDMAILGIEGEGHAPGPVAKRKDMQVDEEERQRRAYKTRGS